MFELTITAGEISSTTSHPDRRQARRALPRHAVHADLYLTGDHAGHKDASNEGETTVFGLLRLDSGSRQPRRVGTATITAAAAAPTHAPIPTGVAAP
jgi:hypothetical protein